MTASTQQAGIALIDEIDDDIETQQTCLTDETAAPDEQPAAGDAPEKTQAGGLAALFSIPFEHGPQRFWEKAAAFWAISAIGVAAASIVTWQGWSAIGPILSCGIACGLTAGVAASGAIHMRTTQARRMARILLPAALAGCALCAVLLGFAHLVLFFPSTSEIIIVSAACYFGVYCVVSLLAPAGALERPAGWPHAAARAFASWHKAAGLGIFTVIYLLAPPIAAVFIAAAPAFFEKALTAQARKKHWAWLGHLAALSRMFSGPDREEKISARVGAARVITEVGRRAGVFLAALPAIIIGSWYAGLSSAALLLAQFGSTPFDTSEKE